MKTTETWKIETEKQRIKMIQRATLEEFVIFLLNNKQLQLSIEQAQELIENFFKRK